MKSLIQHSGTLLKDGMIVFTHCYPETVVEVLKAAWESGKKFTVYTTETRPLYLGRRTVTALVEAGIPVEHFLDLNAEAAIKNADIFLFGCHSFGPKREVINKVGTNMYLEIAKKYNVPSYACTKSDKFDPKLNFDALKLDPRDPKQVWEDAPEGILIHNPGYEVCEKNLITGIITEKGIQT